MWYYYICCMGFAIAPANSVLNLLSADQCHMTVTRAQVYNLLRWRVFLDYLLTSYCFLIDHGLRSIFSLSKEQCLVDGFDCITGFVFARECDLKWPHVTSYARLLKITSGVFFVFILTIALKKQVI